MTHAQLQQWFYAQLTETYDRGELESMYHWCVEEIEGWSRAAVHLHTDAEVINESRWKDVVDRLQKSEPIQYVFGTAIFVGLELEVDSSVLIPRPETEELVAMILDREKDETLSIVDIGTGSGCIPLALKSARNKWTVSGCDISAEALNVAERNAAKLGVGVDFKEVDVTGDWPYESIDIIVSNPPYIPEDLSASLDKNVLEYEPHIALFSPENDPIYFFKRITEVAAGAGVKRVYFETHATDMGDLVSRLAEIWNGEIQIHQDMGGKDRFLVLS
jgi:release factor glutamine methyltransferase